jgi:hypothetical protein
MDGNGLWKEFSVNAFLYPPMDLLETPDLGRSLSHLMKRCEALGRNDFGKAEFYRWLRGVMEAADGSFSFAFYGSTVNHGLDMPSNDIDVLFFMPQLLGKPIPHSHPGFLHILKIHEADNAWGNEPERWKFLVAHVLMVYPSFPREMVCRKVELGRANIIESPFLGGGIGDLITSAAFKALNNREHRLFDPHEWHFFRGKRFSIDWRHIDMASMVSRDIKLGELHDQVRDQMRLMDDREVAALTKAAMRRLRVRRDKRPELAKRFQKELRR